MEPATHVLTGACLARTGLNRKAAYATAAMAVAAELPDIDTLWSLRGPVSGFEHHRGITHTLLGLPFEAALLVGIFVIVHWWRSRRHRMDVPSVLRTAAPVRWTVLYGFVLLALLSHLLLDYTNNYGLRPFFPFNPHWYAASIVFIFDPLIFVLLVAGLVLPSLFALIGQEVGAKREVFRGAGWARAALLLVVSVWLLRTYEHGRAVDLANAQTLRAPSTSDTPVPSSTEAAQETTNPETPLREEAARPLLRPSRPSLASPDPLSPFRWYTVTDFGPAYLLGTIDTRIASFTSDRVLDKPSLSSALTTAKASHLGRVYLDWSTMPWITTSEGQRTEANDRAVGTTVTFEDTRFMGGTSWLRRGSLPPLTGIVNLGPDGRILDEGIDGRFGR